MLLGLHLLLYPSRAHDPGSGADGETSARSDRGRSPQREVEPVLRFLPWAEVAALRLVDLHVVDAGLAARHQALRRELPQLVAVAAVPLTGGVVALVLEAHRDPVLVEVPQALAEHVVQFALPFAGQKGDDLLTADDVLIAVSPVRVHGVGQADLFGVAGVPGVFGGLDLLLRGVEREWWEQRSTLCHDLFLRLMPCRDSLLLGVSYRGWHGVRDVGQGAGLPQAAGGFHVVFF